MRSNPSTPTFPCWAARGAPATSRRPTTTLPWTPKCTTRWAAGSPPAPPDTQASDRPRPPARAQDEEEEMDDELQEDTEEEEEFEADEVS